jgi:hypothetical protein
MSNKDKGLDLIYKWDNTPGVFYVVLILLAKALFQFLFLKLDSPYQADGRKHHT